MRFVPSFLFLLVATPKRHGKFHRTVPVESRTVQRLWWESGFIDRTNDEPKLVVKYSSQESVSSFGVLLRAREFEFIVFAEIETSSNLTDGLSAGLDNFSGRQPDRSKSEVRRGIRSKARITRFIDKRGHSFILGGTQSAVEALLDPESVQSNGDCRLCLSKNSKMSGNF